MSSIDERNIENLLASLTDRQIAGLFEMSEEAVTLIRRQRQSSDTPSLGWTDGSDKSGKPI